MKIYDFSESKFNNKYLNESTSILISESFYLNNSETLRIIISNLNEDKRLVFLLPNNKVISNSGYSIEESNSIIETFSSVNSDLFESLNESDSQKRFLPKPIEIKKKDIWRDLSFKYPEKKGGGFKPCIIIDASDKFSEQFLNGLVLAMRVSSKEQNMFNPKLKNILLEDWKKEGFQKESYACYKDIQQRPIERFIKNVRKIGIVTDKDWGRIKEKNPRIDSLKIKSADDTTLNRVKKVKLEENYSHLYKVLTNFR